MNKNYVYLTLASNNKKVVIEKDSIAFLMEEEGENEQHEKEQFTRVFLKKTIEDISYIDVKEQPFNIL